MEMIQENLGIGFLAWHSRYFNAEGLIGSFLVLGLMFFGIIWLLSVNRLKKPAATDGGDASPRFRDPAEDTARTVAMYQQVLSLAQREGDRTGKAEALIAIGCTHFLADDLDQALVHHQQALVLARDAADDRGITRALRYIGQIHLSRRDAATAHSYFELALTSARQSGDVEDISDALEDLADAYFALGQDAQGNDCRRQVVADDPLPSRRRTEAVHLWRCARVLQEMNRPREARANAEEALAIFDRIDDPQATTVRAALQEWPIQK